MANWFIGLPVAPGAWFGRVGAPPPGVTLFHPEDLHLTIAFLGAVTEDAARAGWAALVWDRPRLEVVLGAVVPMGSSRRPSAFSALLDQGRPEVEEAMGRSRGACFTAAGARPEERAPKAHVTVARPSRKATDRERRAGEVWAAGLDLGRPTVTLDRVALFTWSETRHAGDDGPRFRVVESRLLPAGERVDADDGTKERP
jgi:2'-5' RNA ligase